MVLTAGTRVGPYEIVAPALSRGAGEAYHARDSRLDRRVTVKILPAGSGTDPAGVARFEQEARATSALKHPNILAIYDIGSHEGAPYIVAESLEGEDLRAAVSLGALPAERALGYAEQIARGLTAAHDLGIAHLELKPESLFTTSDGRIKILDFGVYRLRPAEIMEASAGDGTVGYGAPEQVRGQEADHRADIFSFGAILHEMLSGRRTFEGDSSSEVRSASLNEKPSDLLAANPGITLPLNEIVRRCLEKKPEPRFPSIREVSGALDALSASQKTSTSDPSAFAAPLVESPGALASGTRVGPYEIARFIGAGAMGEVYRARDTRLNRDVAVKVLLELFSGDPQKLARLKREAQTLASLNHPNVAAIYGIEESHGMVALAMELVQGEDLAARLKRGALPIDEAIAIAKQIAEALQEAHEHGVVHRDLKPANIKVRDDGTVKVLDFGLAKAMDSSSASGSGAELLSVAGHIIGTPAYMSPEQARGKAVDRRADIWSFGVVLFEMLSGQRPFDGADVSLMLANVIKEDPAWEALPGNLPTPVLRLLRRCLEKDPKRRLGWAGDVGRDLDEEPIETPAPVRTATVREHLGIRLIGPLVAGAIIGAALWNLRATSASPAPVTRFAFPLGEGEQFTGNSLKQIAISPDGTHIVYVANSRLYLRSMSELTDRFITGTDLQGGVWNPAFSPDGQSIVFGAPEDNTIKRVPIGGGVPVTLCEGAYFSGISWGSDGVVFVSNGGAGPSRDRIKRVPSDGGTPEKLVELKKDERGHGPQMLPGGETLLFTLETRRHEPRNTAADSEDAQIVAQSLKSGERKVIIEGGADGRYVRSGHIVFARSGVLFAVPFDPRRLEVTGRLTPVVEGVRRSVVAAQFSVSDTGTLVYRPGPAVRSSARLDLGLIDRTGGVTPLKLPPASYVAARVSPDGKRIAIGSNDDREAVVWVRELTGTAPMRRLTVGGNNRFPIWSPDGQKIAFQSDREGDLGIFWQRADGSGAAERLTTADQKGISHVPETWSLKGDTLLFRVTEDGVASLQALSLPNRKTAAFGGLRSPVPTDATVSPDGRWIAYAARLEGDSQRGAVYVQSFPLTGAKYQIARDGRHPVWSRDGKQLLFAIPGVNKYAVASVASQKAFTYTTSAPATRMFQDTLNDPVRSFDISADGRLVGVIDSVPSQLGVATPPQVNVVLNWFEDLLVKVKP